MSGVFNQGALSTNRQGRLTLFQAIGFVPLILVGVFFILLGALLVTGLLRFVYSIITHTFQGTILAASIFEVIFGGVFPVFIFWIGFLIGGKRLIDMLSGKVSVVEGRGNKYSGAGSGKRGSTQRVLYYSVGNVNFQIAFYGRWKVLPSETMVHAYYTPLSKSLVNVEPIYSQTSAPEGARGILKQDEELEGLQRLDKAEKEAKRQKKD